MSAVRLGLTSVAAVVTSLLIGCNDETTIVQNVIPGDQVKVSGQVLAWRCRVGDVWNNFGLDTRFAIETGDTATIRFLYSNGWCDEVKTDSVSGFRRVVGAGLHKVIVETRYTLPDTFQVYLENDTTLDLKIVYDVDDPVNIELLFEYPTFNDTLGAQTEWEALRKLNGTLGGTLNTYGFVPRLEWRRYYDCWSIWDVPLSSRVHNVILVSSQIKSIAEQDTARKIFPVQVGVHPRGIYICLL